MRRYAWLSVMLLAGAAAACGGSSNNNNNNMTADAGDDAATMDDVQTPTDRADAAADRAPEAAADAARSPAGGPCTMPDPMGGEDPMCGSELVCAPTQAQPMCTANCEDNASQAMERSQCAGTGSTCLSQQPMAAPTRGLCTAACSPTATTTARGACRAGQVCTGWWFSRMTADTTGCFPFCSADNECPSGSRCHTRTGSCGMRTVDMTKLPDGSPCNPMMTEMVPGEMQPRNNQCRGICFLMSSTNRTQGICGSLINARAATACPDLPDEVQALAPPMMDNLAICIFKACRSNSDCRSPLICRYQETAGGMPATDGPTLCQFPSMNQPTGIAGDGGTMTDAATDRPATDAPAPTDAPADRPAEAGTDAATMTDASADRPG